MLGIKTILISFLTGCLSFFFMMRSAKKQGMEAERNININKSYEKITEAKNIENNNRNLSSDAIFDRMRAREKNNK